MDLDFGPDGALYVIEWGSGFNGDNADSGVYRVDYVSGDKAPIAAGHRHADQRPRAADGQLLERRLQRPRGHPLTYAWDFDSDGTTTPPPPTRRYTYTTNGAYTAKLTVKDADGPDRGRQRADHGRQPRADDHDRVPRSTARSPPSPTRSRYKISVTDPEDGTTGAGINCGDVKVNVSLGHDEHAHDLSTTTGCEGTLHVRPDLGSRRRGQHVHGPRRPTPTRAARAASRR